jgi:biopolymer transport protein ExbB/TolQ
MNLIALFLEGGFIMYPLLIGFVISVVVVADKVLTLKKFDLEVEKIEESFQSKKLQLELAQYNKVVIAPYVAMFDEENPTHDLVFLSVDKTQKELRSKLWLLGTVTSSAPFIGLFGTVVGIIKSFGSIGEAGKAGFAIVSADLSEALIATAAGIMVAVIALLCYNFLTQRIKDSLFEYKHNLSHHLNKFNKRN